VHKVGEIHKYIIQDDYGIVNFEVRVSFSYHCTLQR